MKQKLFKGHFKKFAISLLLALLLIIPSVAHAATNLPCTPTEGQQTNNDLFTCINNIYKYALIISAIAATMMIMFAGYMYIFSGGSDKKISTAKSWIATSLLGIAVLLTGFLLLKQINPNLLNVKSISPEHISQRDWYKTGNGNITFGSRDTSNSGSSVAVGSGGKPGNVQGNGVTCNGGTDKRLSTHVNCGCFANEVKAAASEFGVDQALIRAILYQETNCGKDNRTSNKGAKGPMQILDGTAKGAGCPANWATDSTANIRCGAKILKALNSQYGKHGIKSVMAAYNGGGNALKPSSFCPGMQRYECPFDKADHSVCNGGPGTYEETRDYVTSGSRFLDEAKACTS